MVCMFHLVYVGRLTKPLSTASIPSTSLPTQTAQCAHRKRDIVCRCVSRAETVRGPAGEDAVATRHRRFSVSNRLFPVKS